FRRRRVFSKGAASRQSASSFRPGSRCLPFCERVAIRGNAKGRAPALSASPCLAPCEHLRDRSAQATACRLATGCAPGRPRGGHRAFEMSDETRKIGGQVVIVLHAGSSPGVLTRWTFAEHDKMRK